MLGEIVIVAVATLFGYIVGMTTLEVYQSTGLGVITGALVASVMSATFSAMAFRKP